MIRPWGVGGKAIPGLWTTEGRQRGYTLHNEIPYSGEKAVAESTKDGGCRRANCRALRWRQAGEYSSEDKRWPQSFVGYVRLCALVAYNP